ncbi:lipopolysaccharide assembly protein LapB [Oligella sp. MSHR50489EDL]|uniref:lipopolysaccharide assembly protein LapB n=1 Tax=Oligella sp. MSHR50489EDL TaxID=3139409 RepID=UPI003D8199A7
MDFELWWLILIPIVFALGWIAARVDFRQMLSETRQLPDSYFKGLNFLLNEDHDKAIDAFIEVAKLDTETTELHFALGSLFRRRGEIERAIRVHQSLLNRADLPIKDQEQALYQIGQDYFKAGMFDRSEEAFKRVMDSQSFSVAATRNLIRIYESVHDWPKAIEMVERLQALLNEPVPALIHYHCELAEQALRSKPLNLNEAIKQLDQAEHAMQRNSADERSEASIARIAMLRAEIAAQQDQPQNQRLQLESVLNEAPSYSSLVAEKLLQNYQESNQLAQGLALLARHFDAHFSLDLFVILLKHYRQQGDDEAARRFAAKTLNQHPTLLGLSKFFESEIKAKQDTTTAGAEQTSALAEILDVDFLYKIIHKHAQRLDRRECRVCGFQAQSFYWQCPGCNQWETYSTKRLEGR